MKKIKKETIIRTAILLLAIANQRACNRRKKPASVRRSDRNGSDFFYLHHRRGPCGMVEE